MTCTRGKGLRYYIAPSHIAALVGGHWEGTFWSCGSEISETCSGFLFIWLAQKNIDENRESPGSVGMYCTVHT
jgi:hypothetical protein